MFEAVLLAGRRMGEGEMGLSENSSPSLEEGMITGDRGLVLLDLRGDVCFWDLRGDFCKGPSGLTAPPCATARTTDLLLLGGRLPRR